MTFKLPPRVPRKRTETDVVYSCLGAINRIRGVRGSRNNVGELKDERGIPVVYGLGTGSPDIVGAITFGGVESAVASLRALPPLAFTFAIEVKRPREDGGRGATRKQRSWMAVAERRGFLVGVARSDVEAIALVLEWISTCRSRLAALCVA